MPYRAAVRVAARISTSQGQLSIYIFLHQMAPAQPLGSTENGHIGPHPSYIQVAKPYVFEQKLQECMIATGVTEAKEDNIRLQGIAWIDSVRKTLQLYGTVSYIFVNTSANEIRPVRTYNTAAVYYHKFRLVHADNEYGYIVSLFVPVMTVS